MHRKSGKGRRRQFDAGIKELTIVVSVQQGDHLVDVMMMTVNKILLIGS